MSTASLYLQDVTGNNSARLGPLLPDTVRLLEAIKSASNIAELKPLDIQDSRRAASYRAQPEENLPFVWFRIVDADEKLCAFGPRTSKNFETMQVVPKGLQHHWRTDLLRAFDEQVPFVRRLHGNCDARELVVEHLVLPIVTKHRVREILGWFTSSEDLVSTGGRVNMNDIAVFGKTERAGGLQLPAKLLASSENANVPSRRFLGTIRAKWQEVIGERMYALR